MRTFFSPKKNPRVIIIQKLYGNFFNNEEKLDFPKHRFKKFIKDIVNGTIERNEVLDDVETGALWPYLEAYEAYRCPAHLKKTYGTLGEFEAKLKCFNSMINARRRGDFKSPLLRLRQPHLKTGGRNPAGVVTPGYNSILGSHVRARQLD
mgnify:CR=1 FL=1